MLSYHPAKLGGYRHRGSEDIMVLICHVIVQDRMTKWSYDFMRRSPSG